MRTVILVLLLSLAFAESSKFQTQITSLLNMQTQAADAVDSALQLLRDLKQVNIDAQAKADELQKQYEIAKKKEIADLTEIADTNKAQGDEATAYRKHIQNEIETTQEYLVWNEKRQAEIIRKRDAFKQNRCYANLMFVKALKEHDEALEVIRFLREDVMGVVKEYNEGKNVDFAQIKDSASKLGAYTHLFNQKALEQFTQLTQEVGPQEVDQEKLEHDENADDNQREKLEMERMRAGTDKRNAGQKMLDMIDKLEQHLNDSMADLKKNEIQAAWDLVKWMQGTEDEMVVLEKEKEAKTIYMDKILIAIVGAKAHEDRMWEIYFESAATLNDSIAAYKKKLEWFQSETERRNEENAILDDVIKMFIEKVSVLGEGMRGKVDDYAEDKTFEDKSDISREVDTHYEKDKGQMAKNVAVESRA